MATSAANIASSIFTPGDTSAALDDLVVRPSTTDRTMYGPRTLALNKSWTVRGNRLILFLTLVPPPSPAEAWCFPFCARTKSTRTSKTSPMPARVNDEASRQDSL